NANTGKVDSKACLLTRS
ncbi:hypothetical protein D046_2419B, partial [Vibrio parahaemolyticus V-223/04]